MKMFFFEKKNQKTFELRRTPPDRLSPILKSFLLLFFKKEVLPSFPHPLIYLDAVVFALALWLVAPMPVSFAGGGADDLLFVLHANAILDGHWLGKFDQVTLIKGPFYPLFLAGAALLHLPIQLATEIPALLGALLASRVAGLLMQRRWVASLCFAAVALNPAPLSAVATLLYREPLYAGLLLLTLALGARAWLLPAGVVWSALLGLSFAAFWLTREEGLLIVPPLALLAAWRVGNDLCHGWRFAARRAPRLLLVPALAAAAPWLLVAEINRIDYGVFRTSDYKAPPVLAAYSALTRIRHDHWLATVPIPRDAFARAYAVSPAARMLAPNLEGPGRDFWTHASCRDEPFAGCNDIEAGWIMWALRGAVTAAGQYGSAKQADKFFKRLAGEVNAACDAGTIPCVGRRSSLLPPLQARDVPLIARDILDVAWDTARLGPTVPGAIPTLVPPSAYRPYQRVTPGSVISPPQALATPQTLGLPAPQRAVATLLARAMPLITIPCLPAALLWAVWRVASDLRRRHVSALTAFVAVLAGAVVLRIVFLGVMKAILFLMQFRYESPAFPLVLLLSAMFIAHAAGWTTSSFLPALRRVTKFVHSTPG